MFQAHWKNWTSKLDIWKLKVYKWSNTFKYVSSKARMGGGERVPMLGNKINHCVLRFSEVLTVHYADCALRAPRTMQDWPTAWGASFYRILYKPKTCGHCPFDTVNCHRKIRDLPIWWRGTAWSGHNWRHVSTAHESSLSVIHPEEKRHGLSALAICRKTAFGAPFTALL